MEGGRGGRLEETDRGREGEEEDYSEKRKKPSYAKPTLYMHNVNPQEWQPISRQAASAADLNRTGTAGHCTAVQSTASLSRPHPGVHKPSADYNDISWPQ